MQSRSRRTSNTLRWGQPGHSSGGLPAGSAGSGETSPATIRRKRLTFSSPKRYISGFCSTAMPAVARAFIEVGIAFFHDQGALHAGSESAHGLDRQGIGKADLEHARPRRGLAHMLVQIPEVMMPSARSPSITCIGPSFSFQAAIFCQLWRAGDGARVVRRPESSPGRAHRVRSSAGWAARVDPWSAPAWPNGTRAWSCAEAPGCASARRSRWPAG